MLLRMQVLDTCSNRGTPLPNATQAFNVQFVDFHIIQAGSDGVTPVVVIKGI
jgi:hypothetical protein